VYFKAVATEQKVVAALQSILTDYNDKDVSIGKLDPDVQDKILASLKSAEEGIGEFMKYMPDDIVKQAQDFVEEENKLNLKEYGDGAPVNVVEVPWRK